MGEESHDGGEAQLEVLAIEGMIGDVGLVTIGITAGMRTWEGAVV